MVIKKIIKIVTAEKVESWDRGKSGFRGKHGIALVDREG